MKLLLVGEWDRSVYEEALAAGFESQGIRVPGFHNGTVLGSGLRVQIQKHLLCGPDITRLNEALIARVNEVQPDTIFYRNPIWFTPETIQRIKAMSRAVQITYCNDNPFEDGRAWKLWRHYLRNIRLADINFFFRRRSADAAQRLGVPRPRILLPYYTEGLHKPTGPSAEYECDVLFAGHFEPDGRVNALTSLLRAGVKVRVHGPDWNLPRSHPLRAVCHRAIYGSEYCKAICSARIGLVFLSSLNKDTYTTRCFEIPACGTMMLAPRTGDLTSFYDEGTEAAFYADVEELVHQALYYIANDSARKSVAMAGHLRCLADAHSNIARARQICNELQELRLLAA